MTVSSTSTSFLGDDFDDLIERMPVFIQSWLPKAVKCRPVMSVAVTVFPVLKSVVAPCQRGFQHSVDNRVGMIVWGIEASSQGLDRKRLRAIFWPVQAIDLAVWVG